MRSAAALRVEPMIELIPSTTMTVQPLAASRRAVVADQLHAGARWLAREHGRPTWTEQPRSRDVGAGADPLITRRRTGITLARLHASPMNESTSRNSCRCRSA